MRLATWILATLIFASGAAPAWAADSAERTHEFRVTGMTCALCPIRIEKGLEGLEGVSSVSVDPQSERVRVVARERVTAASLESAIEEAGHFEAEILSNQQ